MEPFPIDDVLFWWVHSEGATYQKIEGVSDDDKKYIIFITTSETSPQFDGWFCGLGKGVRVISPPGSGTENEAL